MMPSKGNWLDVPKALLMILGSDTPCPDYTVDITLYWQKKKIKIKKNKSEAIENVNKKDICMYLVNTSWKAHGSALANMWLHVSLLCAGFGWGRVNFFQSSLCGDVFWTWPESSVDNMDVFTAAEHCWHRAKAFSCSHPQQPVGAQGAARGHIQDRWLQ